MTLDRVVIAGGTGYIGTRLADKLEANGTSVVILTRRDPSTPTDGLPPRAQHVQWDPLEATPGSWVDELRGADAVINLCGESIVTRWTPDAKQRIRASRLQPTEVLASALERLQPQDRPRCLVNASAIGYYGKDVPHDLVLDEAAPPGSGFAAELCADWEHAADAARAHARVRVVTMRIGIVLGSGGGTLAKMVPVFRAYLGGPIGSGRQWFPWIHMDDAVNALYEAVNNDEFVGPLNCVAPNLVSAKHMADSLCRVLNRPAWFYVPEFVVRLLLGEEAAAFLVSGPHVVPKKLIDSGFKFRFDDIDAALDSIAHEGI